MTGEGRTYELTDVRFTYEGFDPAIHGPDSVLYELRSTQLSEDIIGTMIVPSEVAYEDAAATPWYYVVRIERDVTGGTE